MVDYFQFVHVRRAAEKFSVLPTLPAIIVFIIVFVAVLVFSLLYLDPLFFEMFLAGELKRDGFFASITIFGRSNWVLFVTGSALLIVSLNYFPNDNLAARIHWHHIFLKLYFIFTSVAYSGFIVILLKNLFGRARPMLHNLYQPDVWFSSPFTDGYLYASFPSGHTTTCVSFTLAVLLVAPRIGYLICPLAVLVSLSRVAIGEHFPSDVVGGLFVGIGFTYFYARVFARKRLLFNFTDTGKLKLRNKTAKMARRKLRVGGDPKRTLDMKTSNQTPIEKT
ncbi:MAG: phosphatase PAP2 family protein [Pseudomonadota bacterium]